MSAIALAARAHGSRVSGSDIKDCDRAQRGCERPGSTCASATDAEHVPARRRRGRVLDRGPARGTSSWSRPANAASRCCTAPAVLARDRRDPRHDRGRRFARQDHDIVDARARSCAKPGWQPELRHRRRGERGRHQRRVRRRASGSSSKPTRATARSCSSRPTAAIVTNVEPDHLDHYGGFDRARAPRSNVSSTRSRVRSCAAPTTRSAASIAASRPRHPHVRRRIPTPTTAIVDYRGGPEGCRFTLVADGEPARRARRAARREGRDERGRRGRDRARARRRVRRQSSARCAASVASRAASSTAASATGSRSSTTTRISRPRSRPRSRRRASGRRHA